VGERPSSESAVLAAGSGSGRPAGDGAPGAEGSSLAKTQGLLFTLLGDYWYGCDVHIPSAALVALLGEFGVTAAGARAALSRVSRAGILEGRREGRTTSYSLSPEARRVGRANLRTLARLVGVRPDRDAAPPWDGRWTCVAYSVPEDERDRRRLARARLRALGFGPVHDALWVSPRGRAEQATAALDEVGIERYTVLTGARLAEGSAVDPSAAWDLAGLQRRYADLVRRLGRWQRDLAAGRVTPSAALVERTELTGRWLAVGARDPRLPDELLPPGWPAPAAREAFVAVYDLLGPLAEEQVRTLVEPWSPEVAAAVRSHSFADFA
jgi:phenylacetic acid degradation operon negative regulatory protein